MTHDLLKLASECEKREVHFKQWYETLNETELFHKLATALREAHAEIERKDRQLEKSEREYLDIRTERDTAIADNASLRAELSTQETLVATLQEQKYAWDVLLGENKRLRTALEGK